MAKNDSITFPPSPPPLAPPLAPDSDPLCGAYQDVDAARSLLDMPMALAAGETLFREGDVGDRAYVIRRGRVEITRRSGATEVVIAIDGPGAIIGEMALIDDAPRSATVKALEDSELMAIPKEAFQFHLARTDPIIRMLLERFVTIIRAVSAENVRLILGAR